MNVTPRSVRVTMIAVEKKQVLHILKVCPQTYLFSMTGACAELHCCLCPVRLYHIQHDRRMRRITLLSVPCQAVPYLARQAHAQNYIVVCALSGFTIFSTTGACAELHCCLCPVRLCHIQHDRRMRRITLLSVPCRALPYLARQAHAQNYIVICALSGSAIFFYTVS